MHLRLILFWVVLCLAQPVLIPSAFATSANVEDEGFAECMRALEEKSLEALAGDKSAEAYRVLYVPSFNPQISMRVNVWPSGTARMTMRLVRRYCYRRGQPIEERVYGVSAAEVTRIRDAFARADFWNRARSQDEEPGVERIVCSDGAGFYMEALRDGKYHRILRTCTWSGDLGKILALFHRLARQKDPFDNE